MQYFKFQGTLANYNIEDDDSKSESRRDIRRKNRGIALKTKEFNQKLGKNGFVFVSDMEDGMISLGMIAERGLEVDKTLKKFLKSIKMDVKDIDEEEITVFNLESELAFASHCEYIEDDDEVMTDFKLDRFSSRWGKNIDYGENILSDSTKEDIYSKAKEYLANETLTPELDNIFSKSVKPGFYGHPVHYIIETDDKEIRVAFYNMILQSLRLSGRIQSKRYSYITINSASDFSASAYDAMYRSNACGAVLVGLSGIAANDGDFATSAMANILTVCETMNRYKNKVLTILCLPRECNTLKQRIFEHLGDVRFVEIKEDFVTNDRAKDFLKRLAKENHVRSNKKLMAMVEADKGYLSTELKAKFDDWYGDNLRNTVFPQYKESISVKKEIRKAAPHGNAYDELEEMIGLDRAKKLIKQAINYYKAQKLFKDKGMEEDNLAMHMVFTGNPGSAKTTCARLFAQIMKDNGLLSKGHIIEMTANELKGKYVGWTAPQVKKKFEEAKGGVLFLDEIYSLVEDREGSFGDEAIATIVAEMENHRGEVICIFAGYPDKTEAFLNKNPGLRSRIAFHVPFDDYTTEELCDITKLVAKKKGRKLTNEAIEKLRGTFDKVRLEPDFGNGRYCRNIVEKAKLAQASRLVEMDYDAVTGEDIETITADDIQLEDDIKLGEKLIGFCA